MHALISHIQSLSYLILKQKQRWKFPIAFTHTKIKTRLNGIPIIDVVVNDLNELAAKLGLEGL